MPSNGSFVDLSAELVLAIVEYCSRAEINHLSQTCKYLYTNSIPALYHTLDLSVHNANIQCKPWIYNPETNVLVPPDFVERAFTDLDHEVFKRQKRLISAMAEGVKNGRGYERHVRRVIWTILDPTEGVSWGNGCSVLGEDGESLGEVKDVYAPEDEPLWNMFRTFTNATSVDICWLRDWREVTNPGPLFPSATSVRLSGCMTLDFAACMLHAPHHRLRHLDLSNLHKWSDTSQPLPSFPHLLQLSEYLQSYGVEGFLRILHGTRQPIGLLDPLIGNCIHLRSLHISTAGQFDPHNEDELDERLYISWAQFMSSVRPTLEFLSFNQGVNMNDFRTSASSLLGRPRRSEHRPMDRFFMEHILPVLVEAPWPRMKWMEIRGVGRNSLTMDSHRLLTSEEMAIPDAEFSVRERDFDVGPNGSKYEITKTVIAFPAAAKQSLRELVPHAAELIIEEEQARDYERLREESLGIQVPSPYAYYEYGSDY